LPFSGRSATRQRTLYDGASAVKSWREQGSRPPAVQQQRSAELDGGGRGDALIIRRSWPSRSGPGVCRQRLSQESRAGAGGPTIPSAATRCAAGRGRRPDSWRRRRCSPGAETRPMVRQPRKPTSFVCFLFFVARRVCPSRDNTPDDRVGAGRHMGIARRTRSSQRVHYLLALRRTRNKRRASWLDAFGWPAPNLGYDRHSGCAPRTRRVAGPAAGVLAREDLPVVIHIQFNALAFQIDGAIILLLLLRLLGLGRGHRAGR